MPEDSASRVVKLAVPRHVTVEAAREPDAHGDGYRWAITGFYLQGELAFSDTRISVLPSEASTPTEAIDVALRKMRERGW